MAAFVSFMRTFLCCVCLVASAARTNAFPTEDEVKSKLRQGMTVEEVVAALGEPSSGRASDCRDCSFHYIAPISRMEVPQEGYIGVIVRFADNRVYDWKIATGNPSYSASFQMPAVMRWELWVIGGSVALGWLARVLLRNTPVGLTVYKDVLAAYDARNIASRQLPSEFRFINHETTLQEIVARVGPYSRKVKLPVDPSLSAGYGFVERGQSSEILTFEYDLPYSATVIVMPEYPFEPDNRIRAVFYRPLNAERADMTGQ